MNTHMAAIKVGGRRVATTRRAPKFEPTPGKSAVSEETPQLSCTAARPARPCTHARAQPLNAPFSSLSTQDAPSPDGAWPEGYEMGLVADWCGYLDTFGGDASASDSDEDEPAVTPVSSPNARGKTAFAPPKHFNLGPKDPRKLGFAKVPEKNGRGGIQRSMVSRPKNSGGMPKAARASDVSYTR